MSLAADDIEKIVEGRHGQPFAVLGQHIDGNGSVIRSFQPSADTVAVVGANDTRLPLEKIDERGLFELQLDTPLPAYRLELVRDGNSWEITDPYTLPSAIGDVDRHLFNEGTHQALYRILGSRITELEGNTGVHFAVWAPNAKRVSVVGDFNDWDGRRHVMRAHPGSGVWDIFIPAISHGALYKYEILDASEQLLPLKHDPYANYFEQPPGNAAIVYESCFSWDDDAYMAHVRSLDMRSEPISIYEVHAGSWQRNLHGASLSYTELSDTLLPYLVEHGFTHVELMPITEHPFDGSWGYQPIGLFAPTSRFGSPDDFRYFVNACHKAGIGVIMDWVPAHFPGDEHGLGQFDGTHLYEHADPKQGLHQDWDTLIYNYGRREVCNYLLSNAIYWIREFHLDGLRVDAVASMLYLDYSRDEGQWIPNEFGGRENLEAIQFLKRMNELVHAEGGITMAEESTSYPRVSHPTYADGLGFTFKWNMGWMHDVLEYFAKDPAHRKYHQNNLTFGMIYAFSENFLLPLSHDEVVYGKGSMINKMPGDDWQKFANLRALYGMMFSYPGKKLNFMGSEIAQYGEWQHQGSIQWHLLNEAKHAGMLQVISDLNRLYQDHPALHETDCDSSGFEWIDCDDAEQSVIAWYRYSADRQRSCITVCNFTPIARHDYVIGANQRGEYRELLNTDAGIYGGSGQGNAGRLSAKNIASHGRPYSISLTLPPLATLVLEHSSAN
ncbi:MAG: 1,4-alpha-glucan branching protein GlgB [Granulosicoccus sp.]